MELRQLRYFVAVAEAEHFGAAAERLHIVQPAVSKQIARLERELGLTLFDRSRRRATLTPEGRGFLPHAQRALRAVDRAAIAARSLARGRAGILRVGSSEGLAGTLDAILDQLRLQAPELTVELVSSSTPDKLSAVAGGQLDAAFVRAALPATGVTVHHLWDEPLLVVAPASRGTGIDLRTLADLPLARADRAANPAVYELITRACHQAGFDPIPGPAVGSIQDLVAGPIADGRCWTLLYRTTAPGPSAKIAVGPTRPAVFVPTGIAVVDAPRATVALLVAVALRIAEERGSREPT